MRALLILYLVIFCPMGPVLAQGVGINEDGELPHPSAMLDVRSERAGLLLPRMTAAQRASIAEPAEGLLVFQMDQGGGLYYYFEARWHALDGAGALSMGVQDAEGRLYPVVDLAGLRWMGANLGSACYANGDALAWPSGSAAWAAAGQGAVTAYQEMPLLYREGWGLLYNAPAVQDARGLCPVGWRVASADDWQALLDAVGQAQKGQLFLASAWDDPPAHACNSSGFSLKASAYRTAEGAFEGLYAVGAFWALHLQSGALQALQLTSAGVLQSVQPDPSLGLALRCVQDME